MADLMRAFNFTPADLDANQHGYMTKEQRVRLRRKGWERIWPGIFCTGMLLCVVAVMIGDIHYMSLGVCFIGPLIVSMIYLCFLEWRLIKSDLLKGDVGAAIGYYGLGIMDGSRGPGGFRFNADGVTFHLSQKQLLALGSGECYRVFFAPNSKVILSVESLRDKAKRPDMMTYRAAETAS